MEIINMEQNLLLIFHTPPGTPRLCYLAIALDSPGPMLLRLHEFLDVSESPYSRKSFNPDKIIEERYFPLAVVSSACFRGPVQGFRPRFVLEKSRALKQLI